MLGKHVWDIIHNPEKLWVRVLTDKYLSNSHIFELHAVRGGSYTWHSIMKAAKALAPGYMVRVGRGNISLWYERWLHKGRICDRIPYVDLHDIQLKVSDLCQLGHWNFELLTTPVPMDIQSEIQSVFTNQNSEDVLIWEPASSGVYSTKNAYSWLLHHDQVVQHSNINWSWVWKLKLPENINNFVWLILHGKLPTNGLRVAHHISQDPSCQRCGAPQENILHALKDCPHAMKVWTNIISPIPPIFNTTDANIWIK